MTDAEDEALTGSLAALRKKCEVIRPLFDSINTSSTDYEDDPEIVDIDYETCLQGIEKFALRKIN